MKAIIDQVEAIGFTQIGPGLWALGEEIIGLAVDIDGAYWVTVESDFPFTL